MRRSLLFAGFALIVCSIPALAQQRVGFMDNVRTAATSRAALGGSAGEVITRIDSYEYLGWQRVDPTNPTQGLIDGLWLIVQDQDAVVSPGEPFNLHVYPEDPNNFDFPAITPGQPGIGAAGSIIGVPGPPSGGPVGAFIFTLTFNTPVATRVCGGGLSNAPPCDIFLSAELPVAPGAGWPNDGLSVHINAGYQIGPTFTTFDLAGAAPVAQGSYGLHHDPNPAGPTLSYDSPRQLMIDALTLDATGCVLAITNQASYPQSNVPPGTASFFSGLHPDASSPPLNAGRADDLYYSFNDPTLPDGSPVIFLADLGFYVRWVSVPLPLSLALGIPGSQGWACMPNNQLTTLSIRSTTGGYVGNLLPIPAVGRRIVMGLPVVQQAIGFDFGSWTARGGPCAMQRL